MMRETKEHVVVQIATLVGFVPPKMSTGSTEPRELFTQVNEILGLGLPHSLGKPEMARGISEAAGILWTPDCESRGATVTLEGLRRVRAATAFFLGAPLPNDYQHGG